MGGLVDDIEVAVAEAVGDDSAGGGVGGDLDDDLLSEVDAGTRDQLLPVDPADGHVFAGGARSDGVAVGAEVVEDFGREEADGALGSSMVSAVALAIAGQAVLVDDGLGDGAFGYAARRDIELFDSAGGSGPG